ncbi:MAG: hypothetical protein HKN49_07740, partial [Gammaproteobacteria bacterium]|nr:hypothetical protein [Gammaproteobacteria bacterium]
MDRVVIFTQPDDRLANILLRAFISALNKRGDMQLVAVCLPYRPSTRRLLIRLCRDIASQILKVLRGGRGPERPAIPRPVFFNHEARRRRFQVVIPADGDINDAAFIDDLRDRFRPTVAISCICLSRFSPRLLASFDYAVNYHNALLPMYRGLRATAWSVYNNEKSTGYTYHLMDEALDEGAILKQESIPVHDNSTVIDLDLVKAEMAAQAVPEILNMIAARSAGHSQTGEGSYYSRKDAVTLQTIDDTTSVDSKEILRRLRAFGVLYLTIADRT